MGTEIREGALGVRPERRFEQYSRGAEMIEVIIEMWRDHNALPAGSNDQIARNTRALMDEYDLTYPEWYYWSQIASGIQMQRTR